MSADPIAVGLELMFARTEPACVAFVRRDDALDAACRARPHDLIAALIDWRRACSEYVDATVRAAAIDRERITVTITADASRFTRRLRAVSA